MRPAVRYGKINAFGQREKRYGKEERTAEAAGYEEITAENLWSVIVSLQGKVFYTSESCPLPTVRGGELFTDRRIVR
ncbi:MAG: hypothetical protein ACLS4Z_08675 [Christensenellaceae bacterium]